MPVDMNMVVLSMGVLFMGIKCGELVIPTLKLK
jgi:hypothetical protein